MMTLFRRMLTYMPKFYRNYYESIDFIGKKSLCYRNMSNRFKSK